MISISGIIGIFLGLVSVILTWHFGTKRNRLKKKLIELENQLSKIEKYSSQTGYKDMIHDSFLIFSYIGGTVLITHGINEFSSYLVPTLFDSKFFSLFISGIYLGSGVILIEHFLLLRKANKSNDSIESMKKKIEKLNSEVDK